jgi:stress response protein SCP2
VTQLKPGQNIPLPATVLRFTAASAAVIDVSALVVGENLRVGSAADFVFHQQPTTSGVRLEPGTSAVVHLDLEQVRTDAAAVLLVVSADPAAPSQRPLGTVSATLTGAASDTDPVARFEMSPTDGESAVIGLELYRRQGAWKVRAVGQGYAGGLSALLPAHGVDANATTPGQGPQVQAAPAGAASMPIEPLQPGQALERIWMIFEDAARSTAAYASSRDYAMKRLDDEMSAAVSDPAMRNSPAGEQARTRAQERHDELVLTAETSHLRDSDHLTRELAVIDAALPRSIAAWGSAAWQGPAGQPGDGIRLGELFSSDRGPLRIPFCVPVPLRRPLWIVTDSSAAAAPVLGALVIRLLAAAPPGSTVLDVIDQTNSLAAVTNRLISVMSGPVVVEHSMIAERLGAIANALELASLSRQAAATAGMPAGPPPQQRILVLSDFPHGYSAEDLNHIAMLAMHGGPDLSVVFIGADESGSSQTQLAALAQGSQHLPISGNATMFDPWTGNPWELFPDAMPADSAQLDQILRALALP